MKTTTTEIEISDDGYTKEEALWGILAILVFQLFKMMMA